MPNNVERTRVAEPILLVGRYVKWLDQLEYLSGGKVKIPGDTDAPWEDGLLPVTKAGAIGKRLSKWLRDQEVKLSNDQLSKLTGDLNLCIIQPGVEVEVNQKFDWNPGDFGDHKSCFFGGRRQVWTYMTMMGGKAVKAYSQEKGVGRCLTLDDSAGVPILFNAYGWDIEQMTALYAYATRADGIFPIISEGVLRINKRSESPIYINQGRGIAVRQEKERRPTYNITFTDILTEGGHLKSYCEVCHHRLSVDYGAVRSTRRDFPHNAIVCTDHYEQAMNSRELRWAGININAYNKWDEKTVVQPEMKEGLALLPSPWRNLNWIPVMHPRPDRYLRDIYSRTFGTATTSPLSDAQLQRLFERAVGDCLPDEPHGGHLARHALEAAIVMLELAMWTEAKSFCRLSAGNASFDDLFVVLYYTYWVNLTRDVLHPRPNSVLLAPMLRAITAANNMPYDERLGYTAGRDFVVNMSLNNPQSFSAIMARDQYLNAIQELLLHGGMPNP